jgi:para-aminobenzoate synthetase/4-amino-4-deoxychorismate lyase
MGDVAVVSASPELFFASLGRRIVTRPMKGTARRGRWSAEDSEQRHRLIHSEKQQAENVMIVDLLRNDLGRVAEFGSVRVDELFTAERYQTLWQLTSTISGVAAPNTSLVDVFTALFPCGSVTGAPKPRTMEIISQRETTPRGVYTGAIGLIRPNGDARFSVGIRTVVIRFGVAEYGVGSGITWDSSSADEYEEALLKAKVLTERHPDFDLIETMRYEPGIGIDLVDRHLARIRESAEYFGFDLPADLDEKLDAFSADRHCRIKLTLTRRGRFSIEQGDLPPPADGVTAAVAMDDPVNPDDRYLFHKTSRREVYERRRRLYPDQTDVILVNTRGEVTESTIANVAVLIEGHWYTPPLESGCLPGIRRGLLIEQGRLTERVMTVPELRAAEQIALVSSLRGWRAAKLVELTTNQA